MNNKIPKIIHYCWFGKGLMPKSQIDCIKTWKKYMPDYEIIRWDESNFDINQFDFTREAYARKKYSFVSDVVRHWALYNYGGIYLDTDVELLKSLDEFLKYDVFSGIQVFPEYSNFKHKIDNDGKPLNCNEVFTGSLGLNAAVIGATKYNTYIKECLEWFTSKNFILPNGQEYTDIIQPAIMPHIALKYGFRYKDIEQVLMIADNELFYIGTEDTFASWEHPTSENTFLVHHSAQSWQPKTNKQKRELMLDKLHLLQVYKMIKGIKKKICSHL